MCACGADKRDVGPELPSSEVSDEGVQGGEGEGEGEGEGPSASPAPEGDDAGEGEGEPGGLIDPDPNVHVGCPAGQRSDHNGCLPLPGGKSSDECASDARIALGGEFEILDLDELAPWGGVPGRAAAEQRILLVTGAITALRPGFVEVSGQDDGGADVVVGFNPATAAGEVVPTAVGDPVELEFREYRQTILSRSGRQELREDRYHLLRLAGLADPDADPPAGPRYGPLLYALGDPFLPPRRERNLENLGITMLQSELQPCAYVDVSDVLTPVGLCRIYRRASAFSLGEPGKSATVLGGQSGEFTEDGRVYRVDSGDTHGVEDSHEDCNVPPATQIRLTYLRPAP